jgi:hypothetical protein
LLDNKLKDAVETHKGKDWEAVAALIPGRTNLQCWNRRHDELDPSIDRMARRNGRWTADEHTKLKDTMETSYGKNWEAAAALLPGQTGRQCANKWNDSMRRPIIEKYMASRKGCWPLEEESKLKYAVEIH